MRPASMARQETKWVNKHLNLKYIEKEIDEKIHKGEFNLECSVDIESLDSVIKDLEEYGYNVTIIKVYLSFIPYGKYANIKISWE